MQLSPEQKLKLQRLTLVSMCSNNKVYDPDFSATFLARYPPAWVGTDTLFLVRLAFTP